MSQASRKYKLTEEAIWEAEAYQDLVNTTPTLLRQNYTNLNEPNRYKVGYLGEWGFKQFLDEVEVGYKWFRNTDGFSDSCDFLVMGKKIDIKTASKSGYKMMMFPANQRMGKDIYVGAKLDGDYVNICGYITKDTSLKEKDFGRGILTKYIPLDELTPIHLLIKDLTENES